MITYLLVVWIFVQLVEIRHLVIRSNSMILYSSRFGKCSMLFEGNLEVIDFRNYV